MAIQIEMPVDGGYFSPKLMFLVSRHERWFMVFLNLGSLRPSGWYGGLLAARARF
jgi:hypothetical protein